MASAKDYILTAAILEMNRSVFGAGSLSDRDAINHTLDSVIERFCAEYKTDNSRFDADRFKTAAGYGTYLGAPKKGSLAEQFAKAQGPGWGA